MDLLSKYLAPGEDFEKMCDRVSGVMEYSDEREMVRELIQEKMFLPNSPALVNAGRPGGRNLMACHLIEVPDSIEGIMDSAKAAAQVFKSGGGLGLEFSKLSPFGTRLKYAPMGFASGPVSFLRIFDSVAQVVMEGGLRRAAMMATLNSDHPDILDFINCKVEDGKLKNFNISVTTDNLGEMKGQIFNSIVHHAHWNGEPGLVFLDHINATNPTLDLFGPIRGVNACSELPLYNYGSCVLGSIVLPNVMKGESEWLKLRTAVRGAVLFLNRIIDINNYPIPEIAQQTRKLRRIGVGVMGWADLLKQQGIPFNNPDGYLMAEVVASAIQREAEAVSQELAERDGGYLPGRRRNVTLTAIAPTGHISRLAGVSPSIYPDYADGLKMTPDEHLDMISAWQKHIDSAISYTVSIPNDAPMSQVEEIFEGAWDRGLKAISVYRDGSREGQPCKVEGVCSL